MDGVRLRHSTTVALVLLVLLLLAWRIQDLFAPAYVRDPACAGLFLREGPQDDSGLSDPHIPPEAQASEPTPSPERVWVRPTVVAPDCRRGLPLLPVETVEEGPGEFVTFCLSPSGRQLAYLVTVGEDEGVNVLDVATGEVRHLTNSHDFPMAWLSEALLLLDGWSTRYDPKTTAPVADWYLYDLQRGHETHLDVRWEYSGLDPQQFTGPYYTGWQATALLTVPGDMVCRAVREGSLHTTAAADGALLLTRDELLAEGATLVRSWQPALLASQEISGFGGKAQEVYAIARPDRNSPYAGSQSGSGANVPRDWSHSLVLTGLAGKPANLLIHVASTEHWDAYPLIANQTTIALGTMAPQALDAHPDFLLRRDACFDPKAYGYGYILYRRGSDGQQPIPLGIVPFPYSGRAQMVWSPDGRSIYFDQVALGRHSISRLRLPGSP